MIVHLAQLGDVYEGNAMRNRTEQIEAAFRRTLSTLTASPFALLTSPDQSVWKVTVTDAGTIVTVKLPKGAPL